MHKAQTTFGSIIVSARKRAGLTLRDLAPLIHKEDGTSISPQYLHDIETDRRNPPSDYLIDQLADVLQTPRDFLYYAARRLPSDISYKADERKALAAFQALRKKLRADAAA